MQADGPAALGFSRDGIRLWAAAGETVRVTAFGVSQEYSNVSRILARDAGNGNDSINIKQGVLSDAELNGGVGDDTLTFERRPPLASWA